jgi:hypothetical protein
MLVIPPLLGGVKLARLTQFMYVVIGPINLFFIRSFFFVLFFFFLSWFSLFSFILLTFRFDSFWVPSLCYINEAVACMD